MPESFEQPKNQIYPTMEDAQELQRIADTKATGANVHNVNTEMSAINILIDIARRKGWTEERLKKFNECKKRLF